MHSLDNNALTNYGEDMSGILQLAESLKVNSSLTSLSYVQPELQPKASAAYDTLLHACKIACNLLLP